ncbi:MAG: WecB/TagA/CpsF family glycosyltransferase [Spirochaetales bacterium]|nr:WecB/TagA/CpsF family glycosyltransferase [Spirochaetales bacterium]
MENNSNTNEFNTGIIKITNIAEMEFKKFILSKIESNTRFSCIFLDSSTITRAMFSKKYRDFVNSCDLVIPTTQIVKMINKKVPIETYSEFDFCIKALATAEEKRKSSFILGGDKLTIKKAYNNLCSTFPDLKVLGMYKGNLSNKEEAHTILAIKKAAPTILIAGKSLPKNEKWLQLHKEEFNPGIFIYTPETFSIMTGERSNKAKKKNKFILSMKYLILPHLWVKGLILLIFLAKAKKFIKKGC